MFHSDLPAALPILDSRMLDSGPRFPVYQLCRSSLGLFLSSLAEDVCPLLLCRVAVVLLSFPEIISEIKLVRLGP